MKLLASSAVLIFGSSLMAASAQQPSALPTPPSDRSVQTVTSRSSIRGFSAGPNGTPRTLFLSNGDAVELGSRFGNLPSGELHKGLRVAATGPSTTVARQRTIDAATLRVGSQTYTAMAMNDEPLGAPPQPGAPLPPQRVGNAGAPPPPPPAPGGPPAPRATRDGRGIAPPPPPPCAGQPAGGAAVPPPAPAANGQVPPPPANGAAAPPASGAPPDAGTTPAAAGSPATPPQQ